MDLDDVLLSLLDHRLSSGSGVVLLILHVHLALVRTIAVRRGTCSFHNHRGHLLLGDRHVFDLGEAHRRRQFGDASLVVLGELDRGRDLEVLPVDLGESDPFRLGLVLFLLPPARLPLLPLDALLCVGKHFTASSRGCVAQRVVCRSTRTPLDALEHLLRRHEDFRILLDQPTYKVKV